MSVGRLLIQLTGLLALVLSIGAGVYVLWRDDPSVVEENHLVEWSQVAFLLLAGLTHAARARLNARSGIQREAHPGGKSGGQPGSQPRVQPGGSLGEGALRTGLALLCVSMVLREVDIDRLGSSEIMPTLEIAIRAVAVVAWIVFGAYALRHLGTWWQLRSAILQSSLGWITFLGCVLYASSWPFDKFPEHLGGMSARYFEQTLQLNATIVLFLAACCGTLITIRRAPAANRPAPATETQLETSAPTAPVEPVR